MTVPASGPGLMSTTALAASSLAQAVRAADRPDSGQSAWLQERQSPESTETSR